jgi:Glycosyl hydrolase family 71
MSFFTPVDPFGSAKRVYAHYFYPLPLSIDNLPPASDYYTNGYFAVGGEGGIHKASGGYLRERGFGQPPGNPVTFMSDNLKKDVTTALGQCIGGFAVDVLNYLDAILLTGHLHSLLNAAQAINPQFEVMVVLDMTALTTPVTVGGITLSVQQQCVNILASVAAHPSSSRTPDGRLKFAAFDALAGAGSLAFWTAVIAELDQMDIDVAFMPILLGSPTTSVLDSITYALGQWGTATASQALLPASGFPGIQIQQYRPKDSQIWEAGGSDSFRNGWASAILAGSGQVQLVTWNDFSETSAIQPVTDVTLATNIGVGYAQICPYFATWYLTGVQPPILQDKLFCFYRRQNILAPHLNQTNGLTVEGGTPLVDLIELLAFLTAPARLVINGQTQDVGTGIQQFKVQSTPGFPQFRLQRNGSDVFEFKGPVQIFGSNPLPSGVLDMTYWSGSHP